MNDVSLREWVIAARPKTLTAAFVPVLCGHLIVNFHSAASHVSVAITGLALLCALLIQIGTNFFNDVIDFKNGVDSESRSGPKRLLQLGKVSETKMRAAAHLCFLGALVLGLPLVFKGGLVILAIGIISILIGYSYSGEPLKLAYRGLAEPFVVLFFGVIAVVGIEWLHVRSISQLAIVCGLQLGLLATVLMVINNIRDYKEDAIKGKLTLVARYGRASGVVEVIALYLLTALLSLTPVISELPVPTLSFIWLLPAAVVIQNILSRKRPVDRLNDTLGYAAASHLLFGLGRIIQLLW